MVLRFCGRPEDVLLVDADDPVLERLDYPLSHAAAMLSASTMPQRQAACPSPSSSAVRTIVVLLLSCRGGFHRRHRPGIASGALDQSRETPEAADHQSIELASLP
eukprot:CAMPEP_0206297944 /NCGR_PEP_ID=MMETSP0106_2-20121207/6435_1 /ASSEMBLY_ACC=CAM_ASM_000206 /TAXON_ID=81532 /ORGANISM="Acanthoeca-like sp., Strain 10tr" /LENGTH=104 /DNA_ID=CAMNT_0053728629 /DNA_START=332 /DNA_END=646 /DNA_ORIENTATION=+